MYQTLKNKFKNKLYEIQLIPQKKGLKILTYHGIVDKITHPRLQRNFHSTKTFISHLELIKNKGFETVSSNEACELLTKNNIKNKVWITFDDGYQNNTLAMEILNDFKMPASFFVSTATIGSKVSIWTVNISLLLLEGQSKSLDFNEKTYNLSTLELKLKAFNEIRVMLKSMNGTERKKKYNEILGQFPKDELLRLMGLHPYFKMMDWETLKALHNTGIDFQSHGHNHELHHIGQQEEIITEEIISSKQLLKDKLNKDCTLFAYPNGNAEHKFSEKILKEAGYKHAFMLEQPYNSYPYQINRMDPNSKPEKLLRDLYTK